MSKKLITAIALLALLALGAYFGNPFWSNHQMLAEIKSVGFAIAGTDAKFEAPGEGGIKISTFIPKRNNTYFEAIRSGDADALQVGRLCFRKLAGNVPNATYYTQSEHATYMVWARDKNARPTLVIYSTTIGDSPCSISVSSSNPNWLMAPVYEALRKQESGSK